MYWVGGSCWPEAGEVTELAVVAPSTECKAIFSELRSSFRSFISAVLVGLVSRETEIFALGFLRAGISTQSSAFLDDGVGTFACWMFLDETEGPLFCS